MPTPTSPPPSTDEGPSSPSDPTTGSSPSGEPDGTGGTTPYNQPTIASPPASPASPAANIAAEAASLARTRGPSLADFYREAVGPAPVAKSLVATSSSATPQSTAVDADDRIERRSSAEILAEAAYSLVAQADMRPDVLSLLKAG